MTFPRTARYNVVMVQVNNLFLKEKVNTFPIDPFKIIKNNKWGLITYSQLAWEQGVLIEDIIEAFQSEDGYTIYDGTNYTIAYNDTILNQGRIRFTLLHEIGHIYMNHLIDFDETILMRSTLTDKKYKVLENEANSFARNVLAPVMVVKDLNIKQTNDLISYFDISKQAANVRLKALFQDYRILLSPFIRFQREHFKSFIYTGLYSKKCVRCSYYFVSEDAEHCPICSYNRFYKSKETYDVKYDGYEVDGQGRAIECPRCGNVDVEFDGEHCIVCSLIIINKCTNKNMWDDEVVWECGTILPGNARYCYKCGHKSKFFEQDLLDSWEIEKQEKEMETEFSPF